MTSVTITDTTNTVLITENTGTTVTVTAPSPSLVVETVGLGPQGPGGVLPLYGSFIDTTTQPLVTTTAPQPLTVNTTLENRGVTISNGSRINFQLAGTYKILASIQFTNFSNNIAETNIFFKKDGLVIPNSNTRVDLQPRKSASAPFHSCFTIEFQLTVSDLSYIEVYWVADTLGVSAETIPANGTHPQAPSLILNVAQVMYAQA